MYDLLVLITCQLWEKQFTSTISFLSPLKHNEKKLSEAQKIKQLSPRHIISAEVTILYTVSAKMGAHQWGVWQNFPKPSPTH